jgi:hypothetical protein
VIKKAFKFVKYTIFFFVVACGGIVIGCFYLGCAYIILGELGKGKKDVSSDFQRGHVVGKDYELIDDIHITQFINSEQLSLGTSHLRAFTYQDDKAIESTVYKMRDLIRKGTRFRVCSVFVETEFGYEQCTQSIYANFIDHKGNIVVSRHQDAKGSLNVTYLFKRTMCFPNENWIFVPDPKWIKEVEQVD